jgi:hypothetical protein
MAVEILRGTSPSGTGRNFAEKRRWAGIVGSRTKVTEFSKLQKKNNEDAFGSTDLGI